MEAKGLMETIQLAASPLAPGMRHAVVDALQLFLWRWR
jgi:hypothetical protein